MYDDNGLCDAGCIIYYNSLSSYIFSWWLTLLYYIISRTTIFVKFKRSISHSILPQIHNIMFIIRVNQEVHALLPDTFGRCKNNGFKTICQYFLCTAKSGYSARISWPLWAKWNKNQKKLKKAFQYFKRTALVWVLHAGQHRIIIIFHRVLKNVGQLLIV